MLNQQRRIPTVLTAEELMDKAFHRASKIRKEGSGAFDGKKKTALAKITASGDIVISTLDSYLKAFPRLEKTEDFYPQLVDLVVGLDSLKKSLGALSWAAYRTERLKNGYLSMIRRAKDIERVESMRRGFYGRLSSVIKQIAPDLENVNRARNAMRQLPSVDPDKPTAVIAGFPNVGKSQLISALSNAAPQVAPYPFTTKGIVVGHMEHRWRTFQLVDTPGLLDRRLEERNDIERQAVLALQYLTDVMVFLIDRSETCGYPLEKQMALLESVRQGFSGLPIIEVESKADISPPGEGRLRVSAVDGQGMEELRALLIEELVRVAESKEAEAT